MGFIVGNYITTAIVIVFAILLVFYLRAEKQNDGVNGLKKATALKLTLSGLFCAVGIISYNLLINFSHFSDILYTLKLLVVLGLFAAFAGDFFLQYIKLDVKKFKIGIYCFTVTQILFLIPMCILNGIGWLELVITVVVLLFALYLMKKQNWQLKEERKPLTAYTVLLTFMAAKAFANMTSDMTVGSVLLAIGAALFLTSDLLLGIWNYHSNQRRHANLNWITYFSGMMLIALSLSPEFSTSLIY